MTPQPIDSLLRTDRGELLLARLARRDWCLRRMVPAFLADREFRNAVASLSAAVSGPDAPPRMLPISSSGSVGDHYCLEYRLPAIADSVPGFFAGAHWLRRLAFVKRIFDTYEQMRAKLPLPVGLHAGRVVACHVNGRWEAQLALCPPLTRSSPYQLIETNPFVLSAIAPERLRGGGNIGQQEDVYAAGVLVRQALGAHPRPELTGGEAVEAQARSVFLTASPGSPDVEPVLRQIPLVRQRIERLEEVLARCVCLLPEARPADLKDLSDACTEVLKIDDSAAFAARLESEANPQDALRFADWSIATGRDGPELRELAARLSRQLSTPSRELSHLERLLTYRPGDAAAIRRRLELRYEAYLERVTAPDEAHDPEGNWMLNELARLIPPDGMPLEEEQRKQAKEDRLKVAMIHGRRGNLRLRARALYDLISLDYKDTELLLLYGLSLREIGGQPGISQADRARVEANLADLMKVAEFRLHKLQDAEILDADDVKTWVERFKSLLFS